MKQPTVGKMVEWLLRFSVNALNESVPSLRFERPVVSLQIGDEPVAAGFVLCDQLTSHPSTDLSRQTFATLRRGPRQ